MLTETQKRIINGVLENYSDLKSIKLSLAERGATISLSVFPDKETDRVWEPGGPSLSYARDDYKFLLTGLSKIAISSHKEILPKEIESSKLPSAKFILFLTSLFEHQPIYEWNCFEDPAKRFEGEWSANWFFKCEGAPETGTDCILFFKERQRSVWVIGLWFSELKIEGSADDENRPDNLISLEELAAKYPKRVGNHP